MLVPTAEAREWMARAQYVVNTEGKWAGVAEICREHERPIGMDIGEVKGCYECQPDPEHEDIDAVYGLPFAWFDATYRSDRQAP